jgi:signal transduction histidine kinase
MRIRGGDLRARVGSVRGGGEVAGLAQDFDEMADALQRRAQEADRAELERRALLADLLQAEQNERDRIAADLHDDALQAMSAVRLRLGLLERQVEGEAGRAALAGLQQSVREASRRLRRLLFDIHPPQLDEGGVGRALQTYLASASDGWGLEGHEVVDRLPAHTPAELRAALYRVALQALANVRQHANARHVEIRIEPRAGGVGLVVRDDGDGFDPDTTPERPGHIGVPFMRERIALLGGHFTIASAPGEGTTVEAWLPLPEPQPQPAEAVTPDRA